MSDAGLPGGMTKARMAQVMLDLVALVGDPSAAIDWAAYRAADWQAFLSLANMERVAPLVYWGWREQTPPGVPEAVLQALEASYLRTLARNTQLLKMLDEVQQACDQAGVAMVALKGAWLARTVYENPGLRPMGDVDMWIRPGDAGTVVRLLEGLGFSWISAAHHLIFLRGDRQLLEVHWTMDGKPADPQAIRPGSPEMLAHLERHHRAEGRLLIRQVDLLRVGVSTSLMSWKAAPQPRPGLLDHLRAIGMLPWTVRPGALRRLFFPNRAYYQLEKPGAGLFEGLMRRVNRQRKASRV